MHAILPTSLPSPTPTLVGLAPLKDAQAEAFSPHHHHQAEHITDDVVMREWTYADLDLVWSMHNTLLAPTLHLPRTTFQTMFHTPHSHILLSFSATNPTDPIGFCAYSVLPGAPNVISPHGAPGPVTIVFRSLAVFPAARGKGVARGMVERVWEEARACGGGEEVGGWRVRVMVYLKRGGKEEEMIMGRRTLGWGMGAGAGGLKREGRGGWWGGLI